MAGDAYLVHKSIICEILDSCSALRPPLNVPARSAKHMAGENEYNEDSIHYKSLFQPRFLVFPDHILLLSYSYRYSVYFPVLHSIWYLTQNF